MKGKLIGCIALVMIIVSCGSVKHQNEYGPHRVAKEEAISVEELVKRTEATKGMYECTVKGKIVEVCLKTGCWVSIEKENGEALRVIFKDHFTIPTDTPSGTIAYFHGEAFVDAIPVDMQRHYAEDAGKSQEEIDKITEPLWELNFIADGILIEK